MDLRCESFQGRRVDSAADVDVDRRVELRGGRHSRDPSDGRLLHAATVRLRAPRLRHW